MDQRIQGKTKDEWVKEFPLLDPLMKTEEVFWINPNHAIRDEKLLPFGQKEIDDADEPYRVGNRWKFGSRRHHGRI